MNKDIKRDNRDRFMYSIFLIIILVIVSIMYASLAINVGVKVKVPKALKPAEKPVIKPVEQPKENPKTSLPTRKPSKPVIPTKKDDKKPDPEPDIPVIDPTDIDWKIEFENVRVDSNSITPISPATISDNKIEINYTVSLKEPGDYYKFNVDISNKGNTNAKIYSIIENGITSSQKKFLTHKVTYLDGSDISIDDSLDTGETKTVTVLLKFRDDLNASDLPNQQQVLNISYKVTYIEK